MGDWRRVGWGAAALALSGCGPDPSDQPGELGNGLFAWVCTTGADEACGQAGEEADRFPEVVATGSEFELLYRGNGGDYHQPRAGSRHLQETWPSGTFTALEPGWASVTVYRGEMLLDYLHLELRQVERFQMSTTGLEASTLEIGASAQIQVNPLCGEVLCAGSLPYVWTVDNEGVLALFQSAGPDNVVTVEARRAGTALVTVSDGTNTGTVEIEVNDQLPTDDVLPTGDTGDTDTGLVEQTGDTGLVEQTGDTGSTLEETGTDTGGTP